MRVWREEVVIFIVYLTKYTHNNTQLPIMAQSITSPLMHPPTPGHFFTLPSTQWRNLYCQKQCGLSDFKSSIWFCPSMHVQILALFSHATKMTERKMCTVHERAAVLAVEKGSELSQVPTDTSFVYDH